MSAGAGANKLHKAVQVLTEHWDGTEADWRDLKRLEFERDLIEPLRLQVSATIRAMKRIDEELAQVRRQCAPSRESLY